MGNPVDRRLYRNTSPTKWLARLGYCTGNQLGMAKDASFVNYNHHIINHYQVHVDQPRTIAQAIAKHITSIYNIR